MPAKRKSKTELPESKRHRDEPVTFVVSGQNKATVVVGLLKEQEREITVRLRAMSRRRGRWLRRQETANDRSNRPQDADATAAAARPERRGAAHCGAAVAYRGGNGERGRITWLLTVLDARSFDDWESQDAFPPEQEAAKSDVRAHLHDRKARVILVEQIESADTIMLTHTEQADADEVEMMTAILQELNPSATVVAREGDGAVGSKVKFAPGASGFAAPAPTERGGCLQIRLEARQNGAEEESEEEEDEEEDDDEEEAEEEVEDEGEEEEEESDGEDDGEEGDGEEDEWVPPVMTSSPSSPPPLPPRPPRRAPRRPARRRHPYSVPSGWRTTPGGAHVEPGLEHDGALAGRPWLAAGAPVAQWPDDAPAWRAPRRTATGASSSA